ncbi:MAG: lysine--tRNA ligase [archaeon]
MQPYKKLQQDRNRSEELERDIIGHGTWLDSTAANIISREDSLQREAERLKVESGLGASGIPHIGSLADGARAYGLKLALEQAGRKATYIAFSDDRDGLRKVPEGFPSDLEKFLGHPVNKIPDPFGCHASYADHMSALLRDALDTCKMQYEFISSAEAYRQGLFDEQIHKILTQSGKIGQMIRDEVGQEKFVGALPYFAVCADCGRIYTTYATEYLPEERKVLYECRGMEVRGRQLPGCGLKGEEDIRKSEGKLAWKVEFAARWAALGIHVEAYGKDIADSVRTNDRVSEEILGWPAPFHIRYEMFLDKGGRKISKSVGNVLTPQIWFRYGSPQSLLLLMFKRVIGTRTLSVDDIPRYMREFDYLEDVYFGKTPVEDSRELAKLKGLYEYCELMNPPDRPGLHVPYNLLVFLTKVAPKQSGTQYVIEKLREYDYQTSEQTGDLIQRIGYAQAWAEDFGEIAETKVEVGEKERKAIQDLVTIIEQENDEKALQNAIFSTAKSHSLRVGDFFRLLYQILVGAPQGPRLGPYIMAMGRDNVVEALKRSTSN